ncbi:MAG: helix-turn-helix transcriptional regulator [Candidatus Enterosoma sp.]|nr:helix-turn-helix transcriptional regulator [bacterium]MDY5547765.1 helix-turn-helix transcriptional regulator [Candidatus Enterosoma sp.]
MKPKSEYRPYHMKLLRIKKDIPRKRVAEYTGVSYQTISMIENAQRKGTFRFWMKYKQLFGLSDEELIKLYENENPENDD